VSRPKVGLALSGGGADGLAHIGVLKVMEEEGLRPDYITGVSMGSLIGAFYSAGFSADSLEKLCRNIDWNLIVSNKTPLSKIIFMEKDHFYNSIISVPLTSKKLKLPSGLINGQQLENFLSYSLWNVADINDFSKLPIPFMCVATDLITCSKAELWTGYLPDAVRASSAVPYIFTPLKIDTMLLVDGGVIRNFAAEEIKKMGADIVIGSYTGSKYRSENELGTVTEIMIQLGFFPSINDFRNQTKLVNYMIEPRTDDISPTSFESFDTLIMRGYRAALPFRHIFRSLADSLNRLGQANQVNPIAGPKIYIFDTIRIKGNKIYSESQIKGVLDISPGKPVDRNMLSEKIDLLYGKNWFEKVKYRIVPEKGSLVLEIDCTEKPRAMLYSSVHYDNALRAGLLVGLSVKDPLIKNSQIEVNSYIGEQYKIGFSYIQFIDRNQKYSLSADIFADNTFIQELDFESVTKSAYSRNFYSWVALNRILGLKSILSLSANLESLGYVRDMTKGTGKEKYKNNYIAAELKYRYNTLNTKYFPEKGIKADISVKASKLFLSKHQTDTTYVLYDNGDAATGSSKPFYTLHGSFDQYFTYFKKWTLVVGGEILYITSSDSISEMHNNYFLGGIDSYNLRSIPAIGFAPFEIPVNRMAALHLDIDYNLTDKVHFALMTGINAIKESAGNQEILLLPGVGLGAGYLSVIGPVKAGMMYGFYRNEEYFKRFKAFISLGYNF
jgi:NTE family protein